MAKREVSCSHPNLHPTQWNQPKPETWHGFTCECGQNWCCPVCGYGQVSYPCACNRVRNSLEKSLIDNAEVWRRLSAL